MKELFASLPSLGPRVIVAGAGGSLGSALKAIPLAFRGVDIIACNYAICAPWPEPSRVWWLCDDRNACLTDWFEAALAAASPARTIWSIELAASYYQDAHPPAGMFVYKSSYSLTRGEASPQSGYLRSGGTVAAKAAQLAYWCGARCISYAGVDMAGNQYWDGSRQPRYKPHHWHGRCAVLGALNRWFRDNGIAVDSLTATALEL